MFNSLHHSSATYPLSLRFILILSSHLRLVFKVVSSDFPVKTLHAFLSFPWRDVCPTHPIPFHLITLWLGVKSMELLMMQLSTPSVILCSLNVVVKNKMGRHEARMANMGITERKRPLLTATCILRDAVGESGLDSGG